MCDALAILDGPEEDTLVHNPKVHYFVPHEQIIKHDRVHSLFDTNRMWIWIKSKNTCLYLYNNILMTYNVVPELHCYCTGTMHK